MEDKIKQAIEEAFGTNLTLKQLWALTLFGKRVRKYCRSNAAFNNMANRIFPYARFRQVTKTKLTTGEQYPGLEISVNGEVESQDETATFSN